MDAIIGGVVAAVLLLASLAGNVFQRGSNSKLKVENDRLKGEVDDGNHANEVAARPDIVGRESADVLDGLSDSD